MLRGIPYKERENVSARRRMKQKKVCQQPKAADGPNGTNVRFGCYMGTAILRPEVCCCFTENKEGKEKRRSNNAFKESRKGDYVLSVDHPFFVV